MSSNLFQCGVLHCIVFASQCIVSVYVYFTHTLFVFVYVYTFDTHTWLII